MRIHDEVQGTPEWLKLRMEHFTASEAPAMLGRSKYMSRNQLLDLKKTGISKPVNDATQALFDEGHRVEALARPIAEEIIGDDFYPMVGSLPGSKLLASYDGLTLDFSIIFEHKLKNKGIMASLRAGIIPAAYTPQLEQQLMVSGAESALFMCSDGTADNEEHLYYDSDPVLRAEILAGWAQFAKDLSEHVPKESEIAIVGVEADSLPVISYRVEGSVIHSNILECLPLIVERATQEMSTILETDQDFADKQKLVTATKAARAKLKEIVSDVKGKFISYSEFADTAAEIDSVLQKMQSQGDRQVKQQKEAKKKSIIDGATSKLHTYLDKCETDTAPILICGLCAKADFVGVMKGKRTIESLQNAVDDELARVKIDIDQIVGRVTANLAVLRDIASNYKFLFNDLSQIINQPIEALTAVVKQRIADHERAEEERRAREREEMRKEEERKAQAKAEQKAEKLRLIAAEDERKILAEAAARLALAELKHRQKDDTGATKDRIDRIAEEKTVSEKAESEDLDASIENIAQRGKTLESEINGWGEIYGVPPGAISELKRIIAHYTK